MRAIILFTLLFIILDVKAAWSPVKNPFELMAPQLKIHTISDCMHVTSEEGDFVLKKTPHLLPSDYEKELNMVDVGDPTTVCGLYIVGRPNSIVEVTMKHVDVNCDSGGLMAFVDGWELNGEYFPPTKNHNRALSDRTVEFCNDFTNWSVYAQRKLNAKSHEDPFKFMKPYKKVFRSSQNAALLQYRIPLRGSFIANVRFRRNHQPCNILVEDTSSMYVLNNFGRHTNCTLTALFPAVVSLIKVKVGVRSGQENAVDYECDSADRLEIGGSHGLDSTGMEKSSQVCGHTENHGPEQAIFCGVTSIRLISSEKYHNEAQIAIRQADENDLELATLVCPL